MVRIMIEEIEIEKGMVENLKSLFKGIEKFLKHAEELADLLKKLINYLDRKSSKGLKFEGIIYLEQLLEDFLKKVNKIRDEPYPFNEEFIGKIESLVQKLNTKISERKNHYLKGFFKNLCMDLEKYGFKIRFKHEYLIEIENLYVLELDRSGKLKLWYGLNKYCTLQQYTLKSKKLGYKSIHEFVDEIVKIHKELTSQRYKTKDILSNLFNAYRFVLLKENKEMGEDVPIIDVYPYYVMLIQDEKFRRNPSKKNFQEYSLAFFSYDIYRLIKENALQISDYKFSYKIALRQDIIEKKYIWIPDDNTGDGIYISRIAFVKRGEGDEHK